MLLVASLLKMHLWQPFELNRNRNHSQNLCTISGVIPRSISFIHDLKFLYKSRAYILHRLHSARASSEMTFRRWLPHNLFQSYRDGSQSLPSISWRFGAAEDNRRSCSANAIEWFILICSEVWVAWKVRAELRAFTLQSHSMAHVRRQWLSHLESEPALWWRDLKE